MQPRMLFFYLLALLVTAPGFAQRHRLEAINAETPEGKQLQLISQETDDSKKVALMEQFIAQYPTNSAVGWVYTQMQTSYVKVGAGDKAIAAGEKLLAIDPLDLDAAYGNLKAAESRKDSAGVIKWSEATSAIARKTLTSPKPANVSDEDFGRAQDYAKQVDVYTEYSLYAMSLQETDASKIMQLADALEKRNAKSQYLELTLPRVSVAARQASVLPAAIAYGDRAYGRGQSSEEMLLVMADYYSQQRNPDKALLYSEKALDLVKTKAKPEGMTDPDWERKKNVTNGLAYWMAGTALTNQSKFAQADKMLRSALPLVKDNEQLYGSALFHLGLANYRMAQASKNKSQIADAITFSKQAAALKGPLQGQAAKNVAVMQKEFGAK